MQGNEAVPSNDDELLRWLECVLGDVEEDEGPTCGDISRGDLPARVATVVRETLGETLRTIPNTVLPLEQQINIASQVRSGIERSSTRLIDYDVLDALGRYIAAQEATQAVASVNSMLGELDRQRGGRNLWVWTVTSSLLADALTRLCDQEETDDSAKQRYAQLSYCCARASFYGLNRILQQDRNLDDWIRRKQHLTRVAVRCARAVGAAAGHGFGGARRGWVLRHAIRRIVWFVKDRRLEITAVRLQPNADDARFHDAVGQASLYLELSREQYGLLLSLCRTYTYAVGDIYQWVMSLNRGLRSYFRRNIYDGPSAPPEDRIFDHFNWEYLSQTTLVQRLQTDVGMQFRDELYMSCIHFLTAMGRFFTEAGDYQWASYVNGLASAHWAGVLIDPNTHRPYDPTDPRLLERAEVEVRWARSLAEQDPQWAQLKLAVCKWAVSALTPIDPRRASRLLAEVYLVRAIIYAAFGRQQAAECSLREVEKSLKTAGSGCAALQYEVQALRQFLQPAANRDTTVEPAAQAVPWPIWVDWQLHELARTMRWLGSSADGGPDDRRKALEEAQQTVGTVCYVVKAMESTKGSSLEDPPDLELAATGEALVEAYKWICRVTHRLLPLATLYSMLAEVAPGDGRSLGEVLLGPKSMRELMEGAAAGAESRGHWLSAVECRLWLARAAPSFEPAKWQAVLEAMDRWLSLVPIGVDRATRQERWWRSLQDAVAQVVQQGGEKLLPLAVEVGEKLRARSLLDFFDIGDEPILDELHVRFADAVGMCVEGVDEVGELLRKGTERVPVDSSIQRYERYEHVLGWQHHSAWYRPAASYEHVQRHLSTLESEDLPARLISFYTCEQQRLHWLAQDMSGVQGGTLEATAREVRNLTRRIKSYASVADGEIQRSGTAWEETSQRLCEDEGPLHLYSTELQRLFELVVRPMCAAGVDFSDQVSTYFILNEDTMGLPLHAAYDHQSQQFLIERTPVAYAPSASSLIRISEHDPGPPITRNGWLAYFGTPERTRALVAPMEGESCCGYDLADLRTWCRSGTAFEWLHLGGHGHVPEDSHNPWEAFIVLRDGVLRPLDLVSVCADFAFVGSCRVGENRAFAGETYGFLFALMSGYTRSCVLADMPIYAAVEEGTGPLSDIPRRVYEAIHKGEPKLRAYIAAIRHMLGTEWQHPYFWAPFRLYGEAGPLRKFHHTPLEPRSRPPAPVF